MASSVGQPAIPRRVRLPFGAVTLLVVAMVAALELGLRHLGGYGMWTRSERSARYGWRMLPDQRGWSRDLRIEERINAAGFHDREWDPPLTDGQGGFVADPRLFRVAVLGNSFTYGTSVAVEDTYARKLEGLLADELSRRGVPRRALVMNFAVQGYRLEQMARVYEDVVRPYRPDIVIVPCHVADPMPMAPAMDEPDYDFRRCIERSAIHDFLSRWVVNRWIPPPEPPPDPVTGKPVFDPAVLERAFLERPFAREFEGLWRDAVDRMATIEAQVAADGGRVVLVALPRYRRYFDPSLRDAASIWGPATAGKQGAVTFLDTWPRFEREMAPFVQELRERGIDAASTHDLSTLGWTDADGRRRPATELPTAAQSMQLPTDLGHLSPRGHEVMAEEILRGMLAAGLLPTSPAEPGR